MLLSILLVIIINYEFSSNTIESLSSDSLVHTSAKPDIWIACSLAWNRYKELTRFRVEGRYYLMGVIRDTLIKKHTIVILEPSFTAGETFAVCNDGDVMVFPYDYEREFNRMIRKENIVVESFDDAYRVARLFVRIMLPMISCGRSFFLDELYFESVDDLRKTNPRNEIDISHPYFDTIYTTYKKVFRMSIQREKWCSMVSKGNGFYKVRLLTATNLLLPTYFPTRERRILKWDVIVFSNGTIKAKLPKGIRLYNPFTVRSSNN